MSSSFYAMLSRMKYIRRWALMRNSESENISEHSQIGRAAGRERVEISVGAG